MTAGEPTGRPPIFPDRERTDHSPGRSAERTAAFLDRIAGDYWTQPRELIQRWGDQLDPGTYADIRGRLIRGSDADFRSAFLELYLHETLRRAGLSPHPHPTVPGTRRRPDFAAHLPDGRRAYLEATGPQPSRAARAAGRRIAVLHDVLNHTDDPNFWLWLQDEQPGPQPPAGAQLRQELRRWLATLDPADQDGVAADLDALPAYDWNHDGWHVRVRAIAKPSHRRGAGARSGRSIAVYPMHFGVVDDTGTIRASLRPKTHAYGHPPAPLVIAVGTYMHDTDRAQTTDAFYGRRAIQYGTNADGAPWHRGIRQPDGYFGAPPDWRRHHVAAVLIVDQLMPWYVTRCVPELWLHPAATHPWPQLPLPWRTVAYDATGPVATTEAPHTPAQHFGLPEEWPLGDAWAHE